MNWILIIILILIYIEHNTRVEFFFCFCLRRTYTRVLEKKYRELFPVNHKRPPSMTDRIHTKSVFTTSRCCFLEIKTSRRGSLARKGVLFLFSIRLEQTYHNDHRHPGVNRTLLCGGSRTEDNAHVPRAITGAWSSLFLDLPRKPLVFSNAYVRALISSRFPTV